MKQLIKKIKIKNFEQLPVLNAINRPGCISAGITDHYVDRSNGKEKIKYSHKKLENILKESLGLMVYQEQIMMILNQMAGFDMKVVQYLRKVIFKASVRDNEEKREKLKFYNGEFIKGCKKNSDMDTEESQKLWDEIQSFFGYGFCKSHAFAYSMLGYQCSYLKTHFSKDYYTALFNFKPDDKYNSILKEIKTNKFLTANLNINELEFDFHYEENQFYFGLSKIKGIGPKAAIEIINERKKEKFENFLDFLCRDIYWRVVNKRVIKILIEIGCFDTIEKQFNRKELLEFYTILSDHHRRDRFSSIQKKQFLEEVKKMRLTDYTNEEKIISEKQFLSCNWTKDIWDTPKITKIKKKLKPFNKFTEGRDLLYITNIKEWKASNGLMCFLGGENPAGEKISITVFSNLYTKNKIQKNKIYLVYFKSNDRGNILIKNSRGVSIKPLEEIKI